MPIKSERARRIAQSIPAAERRTRARLRELCDEILASYRLARGQDLWTDEERREARMLLSRVAPLAR